MRQCVRIKTIIRIIKGSNENNINNIKILQFHMNADCFDS
jgi:hypothetical protein